MDDWLRTTRRIQTDTYGRDPADLKGPDLAEFVRWNLLASHCELTEALEETRWKPWANADGEVIPDPGAFLTELIDAQMFIANCLVAAGITDEDYAVAYRAKWAKNVARQEREGGYVSRKGVDKCSVCSRSFDDVGQYVDQSGMDTEICVKCGQTMYGTMNV